MVIASRDELTANRVVCIAKDEGKRAMDEWDIPGAIEERNKNQLAVLLEKFLLRERKREISA